MSDVSSIDLLEMTEAEAKAQLDDEDFERWEQLHQAKKFSDDFIEDRSENRKKALGILTSGIKDEMTDEVDLGGPEPLKVMVKLDERELELLEELSKYKGKEVEKLDAQKTKELMEYAVKFLGAVTVDFDEHEWFEESKDIGLRGLFKIIKLVMEPINENSKVVGKFREE